MPVVVQKFGGTSVNTPEKRARVLDIIISTKKKGYDVVAVVSAMGRKGEPYATDTFLGLMEEVGPNPSLRTKDLLASCGELISTCIVAHALEQKGYPALPITGFQAGIATNKDFTNAEIMEINPERIKSTLSSGYIAVVAGFQGITEDLDITTLGRGGSDTTAIALGGALGAERVEIYTDVPGVAFVDPRLLPGTPYMRCIDFYPLYIMTRVGAKVVHHRAVKTAMKYKMPFMVKSTFSDEGGTLVGKSGESLSGLYGMAVLQDAVLVGAKSDEGQLWRKTAADEMLYKCGSEGVWLAVQPELYEAHRKLEHNSAVRCDFITILWKLPVKSLPT